MARKVTTEDFIERARQIHGNRFDYSKTMYVRANQKVTIVCRLHGDFLQTPGNHVSGRNGCPRCANQQFDAEDKFWQHVNKNGVTRAGMDSPCWLWTGYGSSYGQFMSARRIYIAHRYSWELHNGAIHGDLCVLHRCDNPPCVRPDHLFLGTPQDNARDRDAKGRANHTRGENHPQSKMSFDKAHLIREMYADGSWTQRELAREFGVHQKTICEIVGEKRWIK